MYKYINEAGEIGLNAKLVSSKLAFDIYKELNPEVFPKEITIDPIFDQCLKYIEEKHAQEIVHKLCESHIITPFCEASRHVPEKVLLAFSGGLDSMYQALKLKEKYDVILFHVKNMNYYTNGKEYNAVEKFAKDFNFPITYGYIKQNTKNNTYKKYWKENSFKNILLYCMMMDYAQENKIKVLSCGDDLRLDLVNAVTGTNVADAKEVTLAFTNKIPYKFEWVEVKDKAQRLKYLKEKNALHYFYSCVNPGRFNELNHNRTEKKFNVKIEKYNCGVCRKCAFHSLLMHYYLEEEYNEEFIKHCWKKIAIGADFVFFNPSLPLVDRIRNLIEY